MASKEKIMLTAKTIKNFKCASTFQESKTLSTFNSIDFHQSGSIFAVAGGSSSTISIYDALNPRLLTRVRSEITGTKNVRFSHAKDAVFFVGSDEQSDASKAEDNCIHYVSLHTNQFIRHFKGHDSRIHCVSRLHSLNNTFMSCDQGGTMKLWDLRGNTPKSQLTLDTIKRSNDAKILAANDINGFIFAVAESTGMIRLYDSKDPSRGAFLEKDISPILRRECGPDTRIESICMSRKDDKHGDIIISTTKEPLISLNPLTLNFQCLLQGRRRTTPNYLPTSVSPDGNFVVGASEQKRPLPSSYSKEKGGSVFSMLVWSLKKPDVKVQAVWHGSSLAPARAMQWNPKYAEFASACCAVKLFVPQKSSIVA